MAKKFDGIIEAARFKNGQISIVRVFERRGPTFSDKFVMDRKTLLDRLQNGRMFVTGSRENLLASTFKVARSVMLVKANDRDFIATRDGSDHDELENVPFF